MFHDKMCLYSGMGKGTFQAEVMSKNENIKLLAIVERFMIIMPAMKLLPLKSAWTLNKSLFIGLQEEG